MHSKPGCVGHQGGCRAQKCHGLTWNYVIFHHVMEMLYTCTVCSPSNHTTLKKQQVTIGLASHTLHTARRGLGTRIDLFTSLLPFNMSNSWGNTVQHSDLLYPVGSNTEPWSQIISMTSFVINNLIGHASNLASGQLESTRTQLFLPV